MDRLTALADEQRRPVPGLVPRIALRLAESPVTGPGRLAGDGTIEQVLGETHHPEVAWQALATVSAGTRYLGE
jgi:hypothetical protein